MFSVFEAPPSRPSVSHSYVWGLVFLCLGVSHSCVWGLVFLRLGVSHSYVWGLVFLLLGVSDFYVWGLTNMSQLKTDLSSTIAVCFV